MSSTPVPRAAFAAAAMAVGLAAGGQAWAEGFSFEPRGRIQVDLQHRDWDVRDEDDTDLYIRRLFIGAQGRIVGDWRYKLDLVVTPGGEAVGVDDAFVEYRGDGWTLFIGEHNITAPLEERTSSLDSPFAERSSLVNAFGYARRTGFGVRTGGGHWSAALAIQGGSMNGADGEGDVDESRAYSTRLTFAPIAREGRVVHIGAHVRHRTKNDAPQRIRVRPQNARDTRWIDAASLAANRMARDNAYGGELVLVHGPLSLQGETVFLRGETPLGETRNFSAFYVDAYWSLTGEARTYRPEQGVFEAVAPAAPLGGGGFGHWALSARYDHADLNDGDDPNRGEQTAYALGLDWVPVENVRFKLNFAHSDMDRTLGPDDDADIITMRGQFSF